MKGKPPSAMHNTSGDGHSIKTDHTVTRIGSIASASQSSKSSSTLDHDEPTRQLETRQDTKSDANDQEKQLENTVTNVSQPEIVYSIFSKHQKRFIVFIAAWAGFFSPVSATIYFPALNALAQDLRVSDSLINLTLTSYMIFQGIAPTLIGNVADATGRRPAYLICFVIYIAANIGLALQNSYAALFVLRCVQSSGSSATIAMASAVVADISTPAERGKYMGLTIGGSLISSAVGPVLGGVLTQFLNWRAIFWFLTAFSGLFLVIFGIFFPETARPIVGNGSIPAKGLNMSLLNYLAIRKARRLDPQTSVNDTNSTSVPKPKSKVRFPNPFGSIKILLDKANAILLLYNALLFAAFYDVTASIPSQFEARYGYNGLQIGLCYIPFGVGTLIASIFSGQIVDRNFQRYCMKLGVTVKRGRDQNLSDFPIEKARIQVALPAIYLSIAFLLIFGWVLNFSGPVPALLVVLFLMAFFMTAAFNVTSTLLIDFYPKQAATAAAANNLTRCLLGAGATALIIPMIEGMGLGWTYTFLALVLVMTSPMLWILMSKGMTWRASRVRKEEEKAAKAQQKASNDAANVEKGPG